MIESLSWNDIQEQLPPEAHISCRFHREEEYLALQGQLHRCARVILPVESLYREDFLQNLPSKEERTYQLLAACPPVNKGNARELFLQRQKELRRVCDGLLLGNLGDLAWSNGWDTIQGDYSLNCTNPQTAFAFQNLLSQQSASLTLSPELSWEEQDRLAKQFPTSVTPEILIYGRLIVMRMEHCVIAGARGKGHKDAPAQHCGACAKDRNFLLRDERGREFPGLCLPINCENLIYSHQPVSIFQDAFGKKLLSSWSQAGFLLRVDW